MRAKMTSQEMGSIALDRALDSDEFNDGASARAVWQQHLRLQQYRQWVFDDDDGGKEQPCAVSDAKTGHGESSEPRALGSPSLFVPGASDLAPDDMMNNVLSYYSPSLYAYGLFETIDIVENMLLCGLIDGAATNASGDVVGLGIAGANVASWFASPGSCWRHRGLLPTLMGSARWDATSLLLEWMLKHHDASISPLRRASSTFCQSDQWCQFLRGMAAYGLLSPDMAPFLPVVIEAAIKNTLTEHALPGDIRDRAHAVATLLLEVAVEYGSPTLLDLSLEVFAQFSIATDYKVMLRVQQSFSKTGRRTKDWLLRSSGSLAQAIPEWFRHQYPKSLKHLAASKAENQQEPVSFASRLRETSIEIDPLPTAATNASSGWSTDEINELYRLTKEELVRHSSAHSSERLVPPELRGVPTDTQSKVDPVQPAKLPNVPHSQQAAVAPLFTDAMEPSLFFETSSKRLGSGVAQLQSEIPLHRLRQGELRRNGVEACVSSGNVVLGSGRLFEKNDHPTCDRRLLENVLKLSLRREDTSMQDQGATD